MNQLLHANASRGNRKKLSSAYFYHFFSAILKRKLCRKLSECLFYTKYKRALIIISVLTDEGVQREAKFVPFIVEVTLCYEKSAIITLYGGHLHYQHS